MNISEHQARRPEDGADVCPGPPLRILIAPDSFKESLAASAVAEALARGLATVLGTRATFRLVPIADGGEGTLEVILGNVPAELLTCRVSDPLGRPCAARYAVFDQGAHALIEMAEASGLARVAPGQRDVARASSFGTGELLRDAVERGIREIVVTVGGSATNDGGAGLLQALGARFHDHRGVLLEKALGGGDLQRIAAVDLEPARRLLSTTSIRVASDVDTPLCGPRGASATFAPQKGAGPELVARLEHGIVHLYDCLERAGGEAVRDRAGAGAAGGVAAALMAVFDAPRLAGAECVLDLLRFDDHLAGSDLVITGEGSLDAQTAAGKAPLGVARRAARRGIPVVAVGGMLGAGVEADLAHAFDAFTAAVVRVQSRESALADAAINLEACGRRIAHWLLLGVRVARNRA